MVAFARNTMLNYSSVQAGDLNEIIAEFTDQFGNPASMNDIQNVQGWIVHDAVSTMRAVATKSISNGSYR